MTDPDEDPALSGDVDMFCDYVENPGKYVTEEEDQYVIWTAIVETSVNEEIHFEQMLVNLLTPKVKSSESQSQLSKFPDTEFHWLCRTYLKFSAQAWLEDVSAQFQKFDQVYSKTESGKSKNPEIAKLANQVKSVMTLADIPAVFRTSKYELIKKLLGNPELGPETTYALLKSSFEKKLLTDFKSLCLERIFQSSEQYLNEMRFLQFFLQFIQSEFSYETITSILLKPKMENGKIDNSQFVSHDILSKIREMSPDTTTNMLNSLKEEGHLDDPTIKNLEKLLQDLKEASTRLWENCESEKSEMSVFFQEAYGKLMRRIFAPIQYSYQPNSKNVLLVSGSYIAITDLISGVRDYEFTEIQIGPAMEFHIDSNLIGAPWAGTNFFVKASRISVMSSCNFCISVCSGTWTLDFSGKDGKSAQQTPPVTESAEPGSDGAIGEDGMPGESGGNIVFEAETIINPKGFVLISNGGKGGNGQPGGRGVDGQRGPDHPKRSDLELMPSQLSSGDSSWFTKSQMQDIQKFFKNIAKDPRQVQCKEVWSEWCLFYQFEMEHGAEIEYSLYQGKSFMYQYLWYKGADGMFGQPGGRGGLPGRGGKGGYAGQIQIPSKYNSLVVQNRINGSDGSTAAQGSEGATGPAGEPEESLLVLVPKSGLTNITRAKRFEQTFSDSPTSTRVIGRDYYLFTAEYRLVALCKGTSRWSAIWVYPGCKKEYVWFEESSTEVFKSPWPSRKPDQKYASALREAAKKNAIITDSARQLEQEAQADMAEKTENINTRSAHLAQVISTQKQEIVTKTDTRAEQSIEISRQPTFEPKLMYQRDKKETESNSEFLNLPVGTRETETENGPELEVLKYHSIKKIRHILQEVNLDDARTQFPVYFVNNSARAMGQSVENDDETEGVSIWEAILPNDSNLGKIEETFLTKCIELLQMNLKLSHVEPEPTATTSTDVDSNARCRCQIFREALDKYLFKTGNSTDSIVNENEENSEIIVQEYVALLFSENQEMSDEDLALIAVVLELKINFCCREEEYFPALIESFTPFTSVESSTVSILLVSNHPPLFVKLQSYPHCSRLQELLEAHRIKNQFLKLESPIEVLSLLNSFNQKLSDLDIGSQKSTDESEPEQLEGTGPNRDSQEELQSQGNKDINQYDDLPSYYNALTNKLLIDKIIEIMGKSGLDSVTIEQLLWLIGHGGILQCLLSRFEVEGCEIQEEDIRALSTFTFDNLQTFPGSAKEISLLIQWIISSVPQCYWLEEILLFQLEETVSRVIGSTFGDRRLEEIFRAYLYRTPNMILVNTLKQKIEKLKPQQQDQEPSLSLDHIYDIVGKISNIKHVHRAIYEQLMELELSYWPEYLDTAWLVSDFLDRFTVADSTEKNESFNTALYFLFHLVNESQLMAIELIKWLTGTQFMTLDEVNVLFSALCYKQLSASTEFFDQLKSVSSTAEFYEFVKIEIERKKQDNLVKSRTLDNILEVLVKDGNTNIKEDEIEKAGRLCAEIGTKYVSDVVGKSEEEKVNHLRQKVEDWVRKWNSRPNRNTGGAPRTEDVAEMIGVISNGIEALCGFRLWDVQKMAIVLLLKGNGNILAEVATGQGKSIIVVVTAIITCLSGGKCDVITSSPVLAERDVLEHKGLYNLFGISVGHNGSELTLERTEQYRCDVVYGDAANFQRDFLLTKYYDKNILGSRLDLSKVTVIIDEVDCMLLDNGNNVLYLSHTPGDLDALDSVFLFVWEQVLSRLADGVVPSVDQIFNNTMCNMCHTLQKAGLEQMIGDTSDDVAGTKDVLVNDIMTHLITSQAVDAQGNILLETSQQVKLNSFPGNLRDWEMETEYLLSKILETELPIKLPKYLKPFVRLHARKWIESALHAVILKENVDYVVDLVDRSIAVKQDQYRVIIVDRVTGVDQTSSQWTDGLHQFLQLKHGVKFSSVTLKAIFISNISFFKKYRRIMGMSGTLGSKLEREFLKTTYNTVYITVPQNVPKNFYEELPLVLDSSSKWQEALFSKLRNVTIAQGRSAIVICSSVQSVDLFYAAMAENHRDLLKNVRKYKRSYEKFNIGTSKNKLGPGMIIFATNLAGRGTNIQLSPELVKAGGLFVILSYLPENIRVEQQAFGRTSRKGQPGSGQLIIFNESQTQIVKQENENETQMNDESSELEENPLKSFKFNNFFEIVNLKKERDETEKQRVISIKAHYHEYIAKEEILLDSFSQAYAKLSSQSDSKLTSEQRDVVLASVLDQWAFLIDQIGQNYENIKKSSKENLKSDGSEAFRQGEKDVQKLIQKILDKYSPLELVKYPNHFINLGKLMLQPEFKEYKDEEALATFNNIISSEPEFSGPALYYKAACVIRNSSTAISEFEKCLHLALCWFNKRIEIHNSNPARLLKVNSLFFRNTDEGTEPKSSFKKMSQRIGYEKQQGNFVQLYGQYTRSIKSLIGDDVYADKFVSTALKDEPSKLSLLLSLIEHGVVTPVRRCTYATSDSISSIANQYGVSAKELEEAIGNGAKLSLQNPRVNVDLPSSEEFSQLAIKAGFIDKTNNYILADKVQKKEEAAADKDMEEKIDFDNLIKDKIISEELLQLDLKKFVLLKGTLQLSDTTESGTKIKGYTVINPKHEFNKVERSKMVTLGIISPNLDNLVQENNLPKFYQVHQNLFINILPSHRTEAEKAELAKFIVNFLTTHNFVDLASGLLQPEFLDPDQFSKLSWGNLNIFKEEICTILSVKCAYRICILQLLEKMKKQNSNEQDNIDGVFEIRIASNPQKQLFYELMGEGVLEMPKVELKVGNVLSEIQKMTAASVGKISLELQDEDEDDSGSSARILKKALNELCQIIEKSEVQSDIANILESCISQIKGMDEPTAKLTHLYHMYDSDTENLKSVIEELLLIQNNGIDKLITLDERTYTFKMILGATLTFLGGLLQLVAGIAITILSAGALTYVGDFLISEGIGDMIYATETFISGYYSFQDYLQHKWKSCLVSLVCCGVGALMSKGVTVSKYGAKIAGNTSGLSKLTGSELIKTVGKRQLAKFVVKDIGSRLLRSGVDVAMSKLIDLGLQNCLKQFTKDIVASLKQSLKSLIKSLGLEKLLAMICTVRGEEETKMTCQQVERELRRDTLEQDVKSWCLRLINSTLGGFQGGRAKFHTSRNTEGGKWINILLNLFKVSQFVTEISLLCTKMQRYMTTFKNGIQTRANALEVDDGIKDFDEKCKYTSDSESFKKLLKEVEKQLEVEVGDLLTQHLEGHLMMPLLQLVNDKLLDNATVRTHRVYRLIRNKQLSTRLGKTNIAYKKLKRKVAIYDENDLDTAIDVMYQERQKHEAKLIKLMKKCSDPELYANIVSSGAPASLVEVQALANLTGKLIQISGVNDVNFQTEVCPRGKGKSDFIDNDKDIIKINLEDHHFTQVTPNTNSSSTNKPLTGMGQKYEKGAYFDNDCLMRAALESQNGKVSGQKVDTPKELRRLISEMIRVDPYLKDMIHSRHHAFFWGQGSFGGAKQLKKFGEIRKEVRMNPGIASDLIGIHGLYTDTQTFSIKLPKNSSENKSKRPITEADHLFPGVAIETMTDDTKIVMMNRLKNKGTLTPTVWKHLCKNLGISKGLPELPSR